MPSGFIYTGILSIRWLSADSAANAAPTRASHPGKRPGECGADPARTEQLQTCDGYHGADRLVMRIGWSRPGDGDTLRYHRAQRRSTGRRGWYRAETCNRGSIHSTTNGGRKQCTIQCSTGCRNGILQAGAAKGSRPGERPPEPSLTKLLTKSPNARVF